MRLGVHQRDNWLCKMCGAPLQARSARLRFVIPPFYGGEKLPGNLHTICRCCSSGLTSLRYQPPTNLIQLLTMIRKASRQDQKAVLNWLQGKHV